MINTLFTETTKTTPAKSGQGKLSAKGPLFIFYFFKSNLQNRTSLKGPLDFSALCEFFSKNFLMSQKSPPSSFLIFCNRMYVNKSQRAPFGIFRHYAIFSERKIRFCFFLFPVAEKVVSES